MRLACQHMTALNYAHPGLSPSSSENHYAARLLPHAQTASFQTTRERNIHSSGELDLVQTPQAASLVRAPSVKLRPFFWSKLPWKADFIWSRVQPGTLNEEQLSALEALFAQTTASPQGKAAASRGASLCCHLY